MHQFALASFRWLSQPIPAFLSTAVIYDTHFPHHFALATELDRKSTDWVMNCWLMGLASLIGEATRDGIRNLITNVDALKLRVQQAVEEDKEKDEWGAGFEERQKQRDERG